MDNLNAQNALRAVVAILTGGISELDSVAGKIAEAANNEGRAIMSEDSGLGTVVTKIGQMYEANLNQAIRKKLQELMEDYTAYVNATVANEDTTSDEVNNFASILDGISGVIGGLSH